MGHSTTYIPCSSALLLFVDFMGVEWNQLSEKATSYLNNPMDYVFNWTDFQFCPWFSRNEFFKFWPKKIHKFYLGHINFQKLVSISVLGLDLQIITKEEVTILTFVLKKFHFSIYKMLIWSSIEVKLPREGGDFSPCF